MKKIRILFAAIFFMPALVVGFITAAAKTGFDTGIELFEEV